MKRWFEERGYRGMEDSGRWVGHRGESVVEVWPGDVTLSTADPAEVAAFVERFGPVERGSVAGVTVLRCRRSSADRS